MDQTENHWHERLRGLLPGLTERLRRPGALAWCILAIFSVGLFAVGVPTTVDSYDTAVAPTFLIYTVLCGSILLCPRLPWVGSLLQLIGLGGLVALTADSPGQYWPLPVAGLLAFSALVMAIGVWGSWLFSIVVWWAGIVVILIVAAIESRQFGGLKEWQDGLIVDSSISALVLGLSIALGQRQRIRSQLADAKRDVELEHARREHAEERGRIAREMHDVVVHSMSLVHMQASSAPYRLRGLDEPARAEFENIARSARSALNEMRQVLGVLRPDVDGVPLTPQPQLTDLSELALVTSRAGSNVALEIDDAALRASSVLQLAAYRIVQEALGNVLRHAPGADVDAQVTVHANQLLIAIINGSAQPNHTHHAAEERGSGGLGLRGMSERAEQFSGRIEHGPTSEGGFRVVAIFPFRNSNEMSAAE